MGNQLTGDFSFNQALSVVDYCGDIEKNKKSGNTKGVTYSPNFSPNNIKRLILCPDLVYAEYHITTPANGKNKIKNISPQVLTKIATREDYKPIINIVSDHICASIEEIVLCGLSRDNNYSLSSADLDWESLVRTYKNSGSDLTETFKSRYSRLRYIVVAPSMNFTSLMNYYQGEGSYFIGDTQAIRSMATVKEINDKNSWYLGWGSTAGTYTLDSKDSKLNAYFKKVKEDKLKANLDADIKKVASERLKSVSFEFNTVFKNYEGVFDCYNRIFVFINKAPNYLVKEVGVKSNLPTPNKVNLYKCSVLPESYTNILPEKCDEKVAIKKNIELLKKERMLLYSDLLSLLMNLLCDVGRNYPVVLTLFMKNSDRAIQVSPSLESLNTLLESITGYKFEGARFNDSFANVCTYITTFFISNQSGKPITKYREKTTWMEVLKND